MKHHAIPHLYFLLIVVLIALIFLVGTISAFSNAHAATSAAATATAGVPPRSTRTPLPSATAVPADIPGDTSGAMTLAVAMVLIVLSGILWGGYRPRKRKGSQK